MRLMLVLPNQGDAAHLYERARPLRRQFLRRATRDLRAVLQLDGIDFRIASLPSLPRAFRPLLRPAGARRQVTARAAPAVPPSELVFSLEFPNNDQAGRFIAATAGRGDLKVGVDLPIAALDHWCPEGDLPPLFQTRDKALALIRPPTLAGAGGPPPGTGANVVMIDLGLNRDALAYQVPAVQLAGRWTLPHDGSGPVFQAGSGESDFRGHGSMVAAAVLTVAPGARLFDLPLLPPRVTDVVAWTSSAHAALDQVATNIAAWQQAGTYPGRWILCNAWGIYDRRQEAAPVGSTANYTGNPQHPLNQLIACLDKAGLDVVFAAGNAGQFCPNSQCGPGDTGPGSSIFGAACLDQVLTVGAVRADGAWIGYSSQGPGQPGFAAAAGQPVAKPDVCAPSHFVDPGDGAFVSSGTSCACGIATGALAVLRQDGSPHVGATPAALRQHLRDTARKPPGVAAGYDVRLGWGIIDLGAAAGQPIAEAMPAEAGAV